MVKGGFETMSKNLKKKKSSLASKVIIISLIILAIPTSFVAYTGIKSLMGRGTPVVGNRFSNDQDPKISNKDVQALEEELSASIAGPQFKVELASATLRIYALDASITTDTMEGLQKSIYDVVTTRFSEETYFTKSGTQKQYDLEIHTFNEAKPSDESKENFQYGIYVKNSSVEKPYSQVLSQPLSQSTVDYFYELEQKADEAVDKPNEDGFDDNIGEEN